RQAAGRAGVAQGVTAVGAAADPVVLARAARRDEPDHEPRLPHGAALRNARAPRARAVSARCAPRVAPHDAEPRQSCHGCRLAAEAGQSTGFKPVGFIEVAADRDRLEEYRRVSAFNRLCGVDVHEISPGQVKELFPLARTDDLLAGFNVKEDGRANPVDVTM